MANVVIYDPNDVVVPNRVIQVHFSVNTPDWTSGVNTIVNPNLSAVVGVPREYWKNISGSIVEMNAAEKLAVDNETLPFKLTGDYGPIDKISYKLFGLCREKIMNASGLITEERYWKNYDPPTKVFSDLVIKETNTYVIDAATDVPNKRDKHINWYLADGTDTKIGYSKDLTTYYNLISGMGIAEKGRSVLIEKTKEYGLLNIIGEYAPGVSNANHFLSLATASNTIDDYIQSITQPLIDFINASTETYMTTAIKSGMVAVLSA